jgi:hypothetical protein
MTMAEQPAQARERTPEEKAAIERGGKRWAIGIGVAIVGIVILVATYNPHHEATPAEKQADAKRACQEQFIPARLKAPGTAQFTDVAVTELGGSYRVAGSVDSQNGFGALVRASFTCSVRLDGDNWVLEAAAVTG